MFYRLILLVICMYLCSCEHSESNPRIQYSSNYISIDGDYWSIHCDVLDNVFPFPLKDSLASISSYYNETSAGAIQNYGMNDSMYHYSDKKYDVNVAESLEVGFQKRYSYLLEGRAKGKSCALLNGIKIGGKVDQLIDDLPVIIMGEESKITKAELVKRLSSVKEIEFYDQWGLYTHTYKINQGRIQELIVNFN